MDIRDIDRAAREAFGKQVGVTKTPDGIVKIDTALKFISGNEMLAFISKTGIVNFEVHPQGEFLMIGVPK